MSTAARIKRLAGQLPVIGQEGVLRSPHNRLTTQHHWNTSEIKKGQKKFLIIFTNRFAKHKIITELITHSEQNITVAK